MAVVDGEDALKEGAWPGRLTRTGVLLSMFAGV